MKKVLALVLAVIMVCTMAMAITITVPTPATAPTTTTGIEPGEITLTAANIDKDGYFYVQLHDNLFSAVNGADITEKNFKVAVSTTPASTVVYSTDNHAYLKIANVDMPKDGKADFTINSLTITYLGNGTNVMTVGVKDGVLVVTDQKINGNTVAKENLPTITDGTNPIKAAYDVFYATEVNSTDVGVTTPGWYKADGAAKTYTVSDVSSNPVATVKIAKNAFLKATYVDVADYDTAKLIEAATKADGTVSVAGGVTLSETATFTLNYGDNVYVYTLNEDGTVSTSPLKFVDGKGWTMTGKTMPLTAVSTVKLATVAGTTTPGTTTNPVTGANDVVGVAAALAVVALVSGAAISLKK